MLFLYISHFALKDLFSKRLSLYFTSPFFSTHCPYSIQNKLIKKVTIQPVLRKNIVMNNSDFFLKKQRYYEHLFISN
jgi:hypothetical protein